LYTTLSDKIYNTNNDTARKHLQIVVLMIVFILKTLTSEDNNVMQNQLRVYNYTFDNYSNKKFSITNYIWLM